MIVSRAVASSMGAICRRFGRAAAAASMLVAVACGDDGAAATSANATTPAPPAGATAATGTGGATAASGQMPAQPCTASDPDAPVPCHCAADHRAGMTTPPSEGVCRSSCVADRVVALWCLDDGACCGGVCDEAVGYCTTETATGSSTTGSSAGDTSTSGP